MIAIVDYGSGNVRAIGNIYDRLNVPYRMATAAADLDGAEKIILPGVGAFDQVANELAASGMRPALERAVLQRETPVLGICVGMQLLGLSSEEGTAPGLGWVNAKVEKFDRATVSDGHLPHLGWNTVEPVRADPLFAGIEDKSEFYFLHSYFVHCEESPDILAMTDYGVQFASAIGRKNVFGVQFHPEKSHRAGVQLLKNFATL